MIWPLPLSPWVKQTQMKISLSFAKFFKLLYKKVQLNKLGQKKCWALNSDLYRFPIIGETKMSSKKSGFCRVGPLSLWYFVVCHN